MNAFESGDEIVDPSELSVNRCEAHIGNFAEVAQLFKSHLTDFRALNFPTVPLLKLELEILNNLLESRRLQACLFTSSGEAEQELAATEGFPAATSLDNGDRNGFDPFIGGEARFAIQAFTTTSHTSAAISGPGFKNPAVCVLAGGALHALTAQ